MPLNIEILDCTLRDGSYPINYFYSLEDTRVVCKALEQSGVKKIEVGHGMGLGASQKGYGPSAYSDMEYVEAAVRAVKSSHIGVFAIPGVAAIQDVVDAQKAGITFLRIGTDVDKIESAEELIELSLSLGLNVSLNVMKSYARSPEELLQNILRLGTYDLDVISIVDSAGTMLPSEVKKYVSFLVENLENKIGFHGHNNLQLAIANSIAAAQGGASVIDATLRGIGRSSGNAQIEVLVPVLQRAGYALDISYQELSDFSDLFYDRPYPGYGIPGIELACGVSGLHSSFLPKVVAEANSTGTDIVELINAVTKNDKINLDLKNLRDSSLKLSAKSRSFSRDLNVEEPAIETLTDLLNSLLTYATKFNKKSILTLSPSGTDYSRIPRLTSYENYIVGHAEVSEIGTDGHTMERFKLLDHVGLDRDLQWDNSLLDLKNLFIYDEKQIIDSLISDMVLNFERLQGNCIFETVGDRRLSAIEKLKVGNPKSHPNTIIFITSKLSNHQSEELKKKKPSKIIYLHPDYLPSSLERDSTIEIYRLDTRTFFDSHIISISESASNFGTPRFSDIGGAMTVAGGLVASRGTVVLDSSTNPKRILGIASGFGTLLSKKEELEFTTEITKVKSFLMEANLRFLRSGD